MKGVGATFMGQQGLEQCSQCMHVLDLLGSIKSFRMCLIEYYNNVLTLEI